MIPATRGRRQTLSLLDGGLESENTQAPSTYIMRQETIPRGPAMTNPAPHPFLGDWSQDLTALETENISSGVNRAFIPPPPDPIGLSIRGQGIESYDAAPAPCIEDFTNTHLGFNNNPYGKGFVEGASMPCATIRPTNLMSTLAPTQPGGWALDTRHGAELGYNGPPRTPFQCEWRGCTSTRTFRRKADLLRHVGNTHVEPNSLKCPAIGCDHVFSRKDNLTMHIRRKHRQRMDEPEWI